MAIEDWDVECHTCHVLTDERGIQIIHSGGTTTIDYPELVTVEEQRVDWWRVIARRAYIWGITFILTVLLGGLMVSLVEFEPTLVIAYAAICGILFIPASVLVVRTVRAYRGGVRGSRLRLETAENEVFTITRREGWPSGFERFLLSRSGE